MAGDVPLLLFVSCARSEVLVINMAPAVMTRASEWIDFILFLSVFVMLLIDTGDTMMDAQASGYGVKPYPDTTSLCGMSSRGGDERPVEALRHGCRCVGVGESPDVGGRIICGDHCPDRQGQAWAGLQRHEKIRRGVEDDGGVGARFGDAGKCGSRRCRQSAAIAVKCDRSVLCKRPAVCG